MKLLSKMYHLVNFLAKKKRDHCFQRYWNRHLARLTFSSKALTEEQIQLAKAFYAPWIKLDCTSHCFYTEKTGFFSEKYVPEYLYYAKIDKFYNDWERARFIDNKTYYGVIFPDVLQPESVCFRRGMMWSRSDVWHLIMEAKQVVIKEAEMSEGGHGVHFFDVSQGTEKAFWDICNKTSKDLIVQKVLRQSKTLGTLNHSSVNTVRLISLLRMDGSVKIYSEILRMGIGETRVDNASSGGITCGICQSGQLKKMAYSATGERYSEHPSSHVSFDSICVPNINAIREVVKRCHPRLPHFRLASWDFALNEVDVPVLIEVNLCYGELDFHQLNNGPLFGTDLPKILDEVFACRR